MFTHYVICRVKKDTQSVGVHGVLLGFAQRQKFGRNGQMPNLPRCAVCVCTQLLAAVQLYSLERSQIHWVRKWRRVPTCVRAALNKCLETASRFRSDSAAVHLKLRRRNEYCLLSLALFTAKTTFYISHCLFSLMIIYKVSVEKDITIATEVVWHKLRAKHLVLVPFGTWKNRLDCWIWATLGGCSLELGEYPIYGAQAKIPLLLHAAV